MGGVRKIRSGKLHQPPYSSTLKYVLILTVEANLSHKETGKLLIENLLLLKDNGSYKKEIINNIHILLLQ